MYEKLDNRTNSTRRQRVSYTLGKKILFISVYELESAPLSVLLHSALVSLYAVIISTLSSYSAHLLPVLAISDSPDSIIGPTIGY
jgi:hypothetical protein